MRRISSRLFIAHLAMAALASCGAMARADVVLWYNGNFDGRDALANGQGTFNPDALVYDNFTVTAGQSWTVSAVYSNNMMNFTGITQAHWEIRSGVSAGAAGTLIASGNGAATQVSTGRTFLGMTEYTVTVSGLNLSLGAGSYWLSVAPIGTAGNGNVSYISSTGGSGAVGLPAGNDGNSYFTSASYGNFFTPTSDDSVEGAGTWDYSMGVVGVTRAVPEPASLALMLLGGAGVAGFARFRLRG
ncbi:MAG: PEP-CTERM sorting domain-containing protein [Isosphaeraceae bacterium]